MEYAQCMCEGGVGQKPRQSYKKGKSTLKKIIIKILETNMSLQVEAKKANRTMVRHVEI